MEELYVGIDCGTQGTKALLIDSQGNTHGRGYSRHALIERDNGAREQEPRWWVEAAITAVQQAIAAIPRDVCGLAPVHALAVSGQQHGLVVLDEQHQVIRPAKLWNDTETASQNAELLERFGGAEEFYNRFGIVPLTGYTVSKLLWIAQNEPTNFGRIRHILLPHEYLNFWLTGRRTAEFGDASGTAFFDVRTREWIRPILDGIDGGTGQLFAALPELQGEGIIGTLVPETAAALGISAACQVAVGGGDNMMGAIGTGNVREGVVTLSLGTSSTVYSYSDSPAHDRTSAVAHFCSSSGGWLPLVCTMNSTNIVTGTVELMGRTVADLEDALESTTPGADGLVLLPFLNGERTPDLPLARGSLHGVSPVNFSQNHLMRAAVEGVTFGILNGLELVLAGRPLAVIQVIGGGARSRSWRQLLADATGATIQVPTEEEAGCLGAAIQAMAASTADKSATFTQIVDALVQMDESATCPPRPELRAAYDRAREQYRHYFDKLYSY